MLIFGEWSMQRWNVRFWAFPDTFHEISMSSETMVSGIPNSAPKYARSFTLSEKVTLSDNFIWHFIWQFTLSDTLSDTLSEKCLLYPTTLTDTLSDNTYFIRYFIRHFIWQLFTLSDNILLYLRTWASNSIPFKYELLTPPSLRERSKTRFYCYTKCWMLYKYRGSQLVFWNSCFCSFSKTSRS